MPDAKLADLTRRYRKRVREFRYARKRIHILRAAIARRRRQLAALHGGPKTALLWYHHRLGVTEKPPGSNGGPGISQWQAAFGFGRVPWCGIALGTALRKAGVRGISSRVASVAAIEDDARRGRGGFLTLVPRSQARPGDAVILFGRGVHVGIVEANRGSYLVTCEGNTSSGSGSQSNGGGLFRRRRPMSAVHAVARPRYP